MKFSKSCLTENGRDEHEHPCFIEDVIFSVAESIQKKKHGNCKLRASQKWINLASIKRMVAF